MSKVRGDNYVVIQGWMLTELELKGNELLVYAIIYGFSQTGEGQRYTGSLQYLADWTNSTKQGVMKNLKSLTEKGLIEKSENIINGVKFCEYYATKFTGVLNSVDRGMQQSLPGGIKQSLPNNLDTDNLVGNKNNNNIDPPAPEKPKKPPKHKLGEYGNVLLTDDEKTKLCNEYGAKVAHEAVKFLDEYIEMKGYKAKSHYLAIRKWVVDAVKERDQKNSRGYNGRPQGNVYTLSNGETTSNPFLADLDKERGNDDLPFTF